MPKQTIAMLDCPACKGKVSEQAAKCPHCGQPIVPRKAKKSTGGCAIVLLVTFLSICGLTAIMVVFLESSPSAPHRSASSSSKKVDPGTPVGVESPGANGNENKETDKVWPRPFAGSESFIKGMVIKPYLRQHLHDPGSLSALAIESITPVEAMPETYMVVVSYRANNAFGAKVLERGKYAITCSGGKWSVFPSNG